MSLDAMKQALEALEAGDWYIGQLELLVYTADDTDTHRNRANVQAAITALRAAIKQAQRNEFNPDWDQVEALRESLREHMAEIQRLRAAIEQAQEPFCYHDGRNIVGKEFADHSDVFPLYTAPRQWQGLTADEIWDEWCKQTKPERDTRNFVAAFALAIEAKLREKNT